MKKWFQTIVVLSLTLVVSDALAYSDRGTVPTGRVLNALVTAKSLGLRAQKLEVRTKKELEKLKKKSPLKFDELMADNLNNSAEYQGWIYEVRDGSKSTEKAKAIAKLQLREIFQKNWSALKSTTVNTNATDNWKEFEPNLVEQLNNIVYHSRDKKGRYVFVVDQWATAYVSKDFKETQWILHIHSMYDGNKLQAGAENITVPKESAKALRSRRSSDDLDL